MGYSDDYLAGQRGDEFIIYKFGSDSIRVYRTEIEFKSCSISISVLYTLIESEPNL
jgi:hypothetical protein